MTVLALLAVTAARSAEYYSFAPAPAWVEEARPDYGVAARPNESGAVLMLLDRQINVVDSGDDYYGHVAFKVLNSASVSDFSQFDLEVDPTYQTLHIHKLQIVRNGTVIDQRALARITELPQETDLASKVYNGRYNVNVLWSALQAGDVLEYSYTLHSRDRIFKGHFAARFDTGLSAPLRYQRLRVVAPEKRPLRFRASDDTPLPELRRGAGLQELVVEWRDRPGFVADVDTPGWYPPRPYFEISDVGSWAGVASLVDPLFPVPRGAGPRVAAAVADVRAAGGSPEDRMLAALRYVQERVSYTSIAIGRGSHEPTPPETVLERLFGDCKDKSLLLASMLGELGITANVALVNSYRGRALDTALPTPYAFDHAIVRAQLNGAVYWLDPTAAPQFEPLATVGTADFERALVAGRGVDALERIPRPAADSRSKTVTVRLDVRAGLEEPGDLTVTTRFTGVLADSMRALLDRGNPEQRQRDYEAYIAQYYPSARSTGPVRVSDDRRRNTLEVRENYRLDTGFSANEDGVLELTMHADELYSYLEPLGAGGREAPLALQYPIRIRQTIDVLLPEEWNVSAKTVTVDNPAFRYRGAVAYGNQALKLTYDYEALADHVEPQAIAKYETDRARAYEDVGFVLTYDNRQAGVGNLAVAPLPALVVLLALGLSIWGAVRYGWRWDPEPRKAPLIAPEGIGGWLLLPTLGVIVAPFVFGYAALLWTATSEADVWQTMASLVHAEYRGSMRPMALFVIATSIAFFVASVLNAVLFFMKRTSAPRLFIALSWIGCVWGFAVGLWSMKAGLDTETTSRTLGTETTRDVVGTMLWTSYMLVSARVAATFTRRRPQRAPAST